MNEKDFFSQHEKEYGSYKAYPNKEYLRILKSTGIVNEGKNKTILDVGCGSGAFTDFLADLGFRVVGIDICENLIKKASEKKTKNEIFIVGDILKLPFKKEKFDLVFCGASLHHIPNNLYQASSEFYRILKPKGKIYFFEPFRFCLNSFLWYWVFSIDRTRNEKALDPGFLEKIFNKVGFYKVDWKKIKKIKHIYCTNKKSILVKSLGFLRKLINNYFLPNVFFVGLAEKK